MRNADLDNAPTGLSALWAEVDSATAFAAGYPVDPSLAGKPDERRPAGLRLAVEGAIAACPPKDELTIATLRSMLTQIDIVAPHQAAREGVEWLRALIYRGLLQSSTARLVVAALVERVDFLGSRYATAPPLQQLLCARDLGALAALAARTGASTLEAAARRVVSSLDMPAEPQSLANVLTVCAASEETALVTAAEHRRLLVEAFGFEETPSEIAAIAESGIDEELGELRSLGRLVSGGLELATTALEDVVSKLEKQRQPAAGRDHLTEAKRQSDLARPLFGARLLTLTPAQRAVVPEQTPDAMLPLVTEGEEYMVGALSPSPQAFCFITTKQCSDVYTLANVLYHELAHCWNMLAAAGASPTLPAPARAGGPGGKILLEGIAMQREWEIYALYDESLRAGERWEYATIFDDLGATREAAALEFHLVTRYWRLARYLRALFDVRIHSERQRYDDFVRELADRTGLSQKRIHAFCFHFLANPGYAPCYSLGGRKVAALQAESASLGLSIPELNTRLNGIGLVPPAFWRRLLISAPNGEGATDGY